MTCALCSGNPWLSVVAGGCIELPEILTKNSACGFQLFIWKSLCRYSNTWEGRRCFIGRTKSGNDRFDSIVGQILSICVCVMDITVALTYCYDRWAICTDYIQTYIVWIWRKSVASKRVYIAFRSQQDKLKHSLNRNFWVVFLKLKIVPIQFWEFR